MNTISKFSAIARAAEYVQPKRPSGINLDDAGDQRRMRRDTLTLDAVADGAAKEKPPIVTRPTMPGESRKQSTIDLDKLGLTSEERGKVNALLFDAEKGIKIGSMDYAQYAHLGIETAKVRYFAEHNLSADKADALISAFAKATDYKNSDFDNHYGNVDNTKFYSGGKSSNQILKDSIYDLFANLDTSSEESFKQAFAEAQTKFAELMTPVKNSMGYGGEKLTKVLDDHLSHNQSLFDGTYKSVVRTQEEIKQLLALNPYYARQQ